MAKRQRKLMNQMNVVPYIDVMLVLLVIFMVTAPMLNPGVVELPSVGKSSQIPIRPLELIIKAGGDFAYIDREKSKATRVIGWSELLSVVTQKQDANPNQPILISADKSVRYERVMDMMDVLQKMNVERVGLMVTPKE
ncbi:MAG: ExbD/TolR family protein [Betaproteobacteria bacterium]|jgi:biopolymer transport protein TolR|nr:ExbD/TolR family protein [Betaproteobacteria bacterium]MDC3408608.1 ExbD/TolR family protein [Burkholderiales bacterium]MBT5671292.1 ExbD/TolR family protein [Betaproteobacteria bacterium]MBT6184544.1 ExbD/TolR family protein [Betaproteobacteria bacterium]MBT6530928.1 ExbD/TolR family protein [Betaproteobacteria bacterium]